MTSHPLPPHDDDDQDLRALYRSLPRAEPSAQLDAAVKQAATRAAAADRKVQQPRRRWHPGWAVAATVVLATGLFFLTDLHRPDVALVSEAPPVDASLTPPPDTVHDAPTHTPAPPLAPAPRKHEYAPAAKKPAPAPAAESAMVHREQAPASTFAPARAPMPHQIAEPTTEASSAPSADQSIAAATPSSATDKSTKRIADIRALLQQGQREKALQALRDLQRDEPDLTLPDDLRQLLPK